MAMGSTACVINFNIGVMVTGFRKVEVVRTSKMFEVQIVRKRRTSGGLQALRRHFAMFVSDRGLRVSLGLLTVAVERQQTVISIAQSRIKSVRVRGRLLQVAVNNGDKLTVRVKDQDEALRVAEAMMENWDIDPLVEDSETIATETEGDGECGVEELVRHYMGNPNFRQLVHDIHDHIDVVLADDGSGYIASV